MLAAPVPYVKGDFSLYSQRIESIGIAGNAGGWQIYPTTDGVLSCEQMVSWIWDESSDVSGGKDGIRCNGCSGSGKTINALELNAKRSDSDSTYSHFSKFQETCSRQVS